MTEPKTMPPGRALVLNTLLSVFISCVVFAVIARVVLVPQLMREEIQIQEMEAQIVGLQGQLDAANAKPEAPTPAPTAAPAPSAAAPTPVPAPAPTGAAAAPAQGK